MGCEKNQNCGGCQFRHLAVQDYQKQKTKAVLSVLKNNLGDIEDIFQKPVFIADGLRRRATFAFKYQKDILNFGFNENQSHQIINVEECLMLTDKVNRNLKSVQDFLSRLCAIVTTKKQKGKIFFQEQIKEGDLHILQAQNGLDIVLEISNELELEHRLEIADFMAQNIDSIRFSYRKNQANRAEVVIEKAKPFIIIEDRQVYVAPGDFLQASKEGEKALVDIVLKYVGDARGQMADLFCGIGTFSYALSRLENTKIVAADISPSLLEGFQKSVNAQMISNISILSKNLFLYPFEASELEKFDVVLFDPPRAGAIEQVRELCKIIPERRPKKVIAVSCNVKTFCRDAKLLIEAGYVLKSVTLVDQFVYSDHSEIVALFEK